MQIAKKELKATFYGAVRQKKVQKAESLRLFLKKHPRTKRAGETENKAIVIPPTLANTRECGLSSLNDALPEQQVIQHYSILLISAEHAYAKVIQSWNGARRRRTAKQVKMTGGQQKTTS